MDSEKKLLGLYFDPQMNPEALSSCTHMDWQECKRQILLLSVKESKFEKIYWPSQAQTMAVGAWVKNRKIPTAVFQKIAKTDKQTVISWLALADGCQDGCEAHGCPCWRKYFRKRS